jgi:hypothetical protein
MSFNYDSRLNDYNSKSYNNTSYVDYDRYKDYKKINIDYTIVTNNKPLIDGPIFKAIKIVKSESSSPYTNQQNGAFNVETLTKKKRVLKEYNKIR